MVTKKNILDMYTHLISTNCTIPDEALEFMKKVCLDNIEADIYCKSQYMPLTIDLALNIASERSKQRSDTIDGFLLSLIKQYPDIDFDHIELVIEYTPSNENSHYGFNGQKIYLQKKEIL